MLLNMRQKLKKEIFNSLVSYGNNASDLKETIEFILIEINKCRIINI